MQKCRRFKPTQPLAAEAKRLREQAQMPPPRASPRCSRKKSYTGGGGGI
jgi:hypothetical protein